MEINKIYCGDCLKVMKAIPNNSIDMILCDLPYGTTVCKWDMVIPLESLWKQYKRIIKDNSAIVLTASQPFTSMLVMSNLKMFKYCWVWDKVRAVGKHVSKIQPMQRTEDVVIFGNGKITYNPQLIPRKKIRIGGKEYGRTSIIGGKITGKNKNKIYTHYQPTNILIISNASNKNRFHPTQKPITLFEYLIKTYTNKGDLVLDNCAGSGTTGVACKNLGRDYILIEKKEEYYEIAKKRLEEV